MGVYFRKRIKIAPGVSINLSKSGLSTSIGPKGAKVNVSKRGTYLNTSLPGTGIYSRQKLGAGSRRSQNSGCAASMALIIIIGGALITLSLF